MKYYGNILDNLSTFIQIRSPTEEVIMRFASGATRFVILTNRYAIKIARFRPIRPLVRIVQHFCGRKVKQELLTYDVKMAKGCVQYILPGIYANRAEWVHSKKYEKEGVIVPTILSLCWLVNIQPVGKPATCADVQNNKLYQRFGNNPFMDIQAPRQYCIIGSKVLLADYGQMELDSIFSRCK